MSPSADPAAEQIAQRGLQELRRRLQAAIAGQAAQDANAIVLSAAELDELVSGAAQRAGAELWRRSLAQAGSEILGIGLGEAIVHPAVRTAHQIVGAPPYDEGATLRTGRAPSAAEPAAPGAGPDGPPGVQPPTRMEAAPRPDATPRMEATPPPGPEPAARDVDTPGALRVEAVHMGGIDSLRVGERDLEIRLSTEGIDVLKRSSGAAIGHLLWNEIDEVQTPRTRHGLRRVQELHLDTSSGRASFELPGISEEQLAEELLPLIDELTAGRPTGPDR